MNSKYDSTIPPDRPDSPVPAWTHYYISKDTEDKIKKELEEFDEDRLLVGLSVGYLFVPNEKSESETDNNFAMPFGYLVDCDEEDVEDESYTNALPREQIMESGKIEEESGLGDKFITELYEEVNQLILQNAPEGIGEYLVSLEVTTAHFSKPKLKCEGCKCGVCQTHHKRHLLRKKNKSATQCTWVCTGSSCPD